ncbi:MAG: Fic family protein [Wenzhouxiangellaceae bacterium]
MTYIWQFPGWPEFHYDASQVEESVLRFMEKTGRVSGLLDGLPESTRIDSVIDLMVSEAVTTSQIEGEYLSRQDVLSSIRNNLGLPGAVERIPDQRAQGIAGLMLAVREEFAEPLTEAMLFDWHSQLMLGNTKIAIGAWRTHSEPMQVISGPIGKEKIHFEAPPSVAVLEEMRQFTAWFNNTHTNGPHTITQAPIRAALAHLYFETIHPFEDGNGRIGRAISEKALSQGIGRPVLLSLSSVIEANRQAYYDALQRAQRSRDQTPWITYFTNVCLQAQISAEAQIAFTLKKTRFFDQYRDQLNARQHRVILRMLEEGPTGFEGGMNARKYVGIAKTSKATATRDLQDLATRGILRIQGGGRSTRYVLPFD